MSDVSGHADKVLNTPVSAQQSDDSLKEGRITAQQKRRQRRHAGWVESGEPRWSGFYAAMGGRLYYLKDPVHSVSLGAKFEPFVRIKFINAMKDATTYYFLYSRIIGGAKGKVTPRKLKKEIQKEVKKDVKKRVKSGKTSVVPSMKGSNISAALKSFEAALRDPFLAEAEGCRVPDVYSAPTATCSSVGSFIIKSDATGIFSVMLLPDGILTVVEPNGAGTSVLNNTMTQFANTTCAYGATSTGNLNGQLATQRVVAAGFKMSNLQPELNATGRFYVAQVNLNSTCPSPTLMQAAAMNPTSLVQQLTGQTATLNSAAVLELPYSMEYTATDLIRADMLMVPRIVDPGAFYQFQSSASSTTYSAGTSYMAEAVLTPGAITATSNMGTTARFGGACGIVLVGAGFPASVNVAEIEYKIHYEGSPNVSPATGAAPVPTTSCTAVVGSTSVLEKSVNKVLRTCESGLSFIAQTGQFLNNNADTIAMVGGALTRILSTVVL